MQPLPQPIPPDAAPPRPGVDRQRWSQLMQAWGFGPNHETCDALHAAYTEQGRHYHTLEHIAACLRHLDACRHLVEFPREVEIALWFHDAVYRPLAGHNEEKSADWATRFMLAQGAHEAEVARVRRLIMATEHNAPTQTRDEAILVDIDLSILGADGATYDRFERNVRQEYRRVPSLLYRSKRAAILRGFLARQPLYTSGALPAEMEARAKQNLARAIATLDGRAPEA